MKALQLTAWKHDPEMREVVDAEWVHRQDQGLYETCGRFGHNRSMPHRRQIQPERRSSD